MIGTFAKTHKSDTTGKERLTVWGYLIGALLVISAGATLLSTIENNKNEAVKLHQDSSRIYNDSLKLVESNSMLSQQRFINIISAVSNYSLSGTPRLVFQYHYDTKENTDLSFGPQNYAYFKKIQTFPGFGMHVDTLLLNLDFDSGFLHFFTDDLNSENSENTTYFFNQYNISALAKPLVTKQNQINFFSNQYDGFIQYNFTINGSRSLQEFLYDVRAKKRIGTLQLVNSREDIDSAQMKMINDMFSDNSCKAFIRILLSNEKLKAIKPCIDIPLTVKTTFIKNSHASIDLITRDPEMTNAY